ncbi:Plug domain-containing protein [bacterium]|nr:Plug domain-containing protein [bacterium]
MKTLQLTALNCLFVFLGFSQNETKSDSLIVQASNPQEINLRCGTMISDSLESLDITEKELPFKVHKICNLNWVQLQDVFNDLRANVSNLSINSSGLNRIPTITTRGDDNTIVIVDGVRYDASILNAINPADIEHVKVATGVAATNYLRNNLVTGN